MAAYDARSDVQVGEKEFVMERVFRAPRELVFQAFTRPEHLARWWAPAGYTIPVCRVDLRPGGVWHYCMRSTAGDEHWCRSVYREIEAPERLVYTSLFADEHGNPTDDIPEQTCTATFTETDGATKLVLRVELPTAETLKWTMDVGMVEGLTITFAQLDALLPQLQS